MTTTSLRGTITHQRLADWVEECRQVLQPDDVHWCDGSEGRVGAALRRPGSLRHVPAAQRRPAPQQLPGALGPRGRGPGGGPHLHRLGGPHRRRAHQQLARPHRAEGRTAGALPGRHGGPDHVRDPLQHGPAGIAHLPDRRATHRLGLRGGEHADHGPHRRRGAGRARRGRQLRAVPALGGPPAERRAARRAVALRRREQVHRPLPRDPGDLVLRLGLRRQRPAGQEVLRPAHRLGDGPRRRLAGRAHADHERHPRREDASTTWPGPSRRPAARPTWR